ncbi:hypothetical protein DSL72_006283 [Monilinia vaccinii-corymbosi]|uniref:Uncharacterized protein n=1 Tax=Monilinia vaccinii-corymbosi TaxID=61207 RepID=A0A8A3PNK2_9HELO|nr:hypothetical protein DSL72_006283 [Monilinia vaccinii-corymbosi]
MIRLDEFIRDDQHLQRHPGFLSYAARYWPNHSELAGNSISPETEPFKNLLNQHLILVYWINAYRDNLEPLKVGPDNVSLVSALSIFAEHGLGYMLRRAISYYRNMRNFSKECLFALELAARNGQIQAIQSLLTLNFDKYATFDTAIALLIGWQYTDAAIALIKDAYNVPGRLINPSRALSRAILMGMSEVVALLISLMAGKDQHYEGIDIFKLAGISGRVEIVKILTDKRSELQLMDGQEQDMVTCYHQALKHGHHELLKYLIDWKFGHLITPPNPQQLKDEDEQDTKSRHSDKSIKVFRNLMERAARLGHLKILESLLMIAESEDKEYRDFLVQLIFKMLDLHWPIDTLKFEFLFRIGIKSMEENDYDSPDLLELLLDNGTAVSNHQILRDSLAKALGQAILTGRETVVRWLIQNGTPLDSASLPGSFEYSSVTPLFRAAYSGKSGLAKLLLEAEADPNADSGDQRGWKALHAAYDSVEMTGLLIAFNAGINQKTKDGKTPLFLALESGFFETAKELLKHKPELNILVKEDTELSLVLESSADQAGDIFNTLLDAGADPFLHSTANVNHPFLYFGADVNEATDGVFGTPFQAALFRETKDITIIKCLLEHEKFNPNQKNPWWGCNLNLACLLADLEVIDKLLELNAAVEVKDHMGRSPIHFALYRTVEHIERISKAYHKDVDPLAAKDYMGRNALHFAVLSGRLDVVEHVLESHGEFANEVDIDGWTPLLWAIRDCALWNTENCQKDTIIKKLLEKGASLLVIGKGSDRDWTPCKLAKYYGLGNEMEGLLTPTAADIDSSADKEVREKLLNQEDGFKKGRTVDGAPMVTNLYGFQLSRLYWVCSFNVRFVPPRFASASSVFDRKPIFITSTMNFVNTGGLRMTSTNQIPQRYSRYKTRHPSRRMSDSYIGEGDEILDNGDEASEGVSNTSPASEIPSTLIIPQKVVRTEKFGLFHLNPEPTSPREGAAFSGDIRLVRKLLGIGAEVNQEGNFGSTPLKAAARKGHANIVRLLLDEGQIEVFRISLERGASVNAQGGNYGSALQCAAEATSLLNNIGATTELLELLLDHGADINMGDGPWGSPFAAAVKGFDSIESNNGDIDPRILLLLSRGADVNLPHGKSGNALLTAASHGNVKLMSLILDRGADINALTDYGDTELAMASDTFWKAYPNAVKFLLDRGADVNLDFSSVGYSRKGPPIQRAAKCGRLEIVRMLLNAGADLNAGAGRAGTAFCAAAEASMAHDFMVLQNGDMAQIDDDCEMWGTALQMAARQGRLNSFNFLLREGADIHHMGGYHHNVLQASAHGGNVEMVEQGLDSGIDVNIRGDRDVETAILAAVQQGHAEVVKLLLDRGGERSQ